MVILRTWIGQKVVFYQWERLKLFFAQLFQLFSSVFTEQSQIFVKNVKPAMLEQGDLLWKDNLTHCLCPEVSWKHLHLWLMILRKKRDLLLRYQVRIEKLSQQDRVSKFCTDAWFLTTVEVGQYFRDERHWRILTIHRFSGLSWVHLAKRWKIIWPKGWIRGNTKIGPVLEVTSCCLQGKYGVEIRIKSVNKDNSHSCVIISHGLNKLVTKLNKD